MAQRALVQELKQLLKQRIDEDAPANAAGTGAVAALGVGADGEPGVKLTKKYDEGLCFACGHEAGSNTECTVCQAIAEELQPTTTTPIEPHDTFANKGVFDVDSDRYYKCRLSKRRYHKYSAYVGEDELGQAIRAYALANPKAPIVLRNKDTGAMLHLRYGTTEQGFNHHSYTDKKHQPRVTERSIVSTVGLN